MAGAAAYLVCPLLTAAYHVPRNDALALLDATDARALGEWCGYLADWTRVNHLRTISAALGCALLVLSRGTS